MTQNAIVTKLIDAENAEVSVLRTTACGGNCASCGGTCSYRNQISARAVNTVGAVPGDRVTVKSVSSAVIGRASLVYLLPLAFFFTGYSFAYMFGAPEGLTVIISVASLLLGVAAVVLINRLFLKERRMRLEIVSVLGRE